MSSYSFVIGNGIVILLMAVGMGFLGGAETFTGENIVIGNADDLVANGEVSNVSEVDFDTSRLLYEPDFQSIDTPISGTQRGYTWTGISSEKGDYGYLVYDVSNINSETTIYYDNPSIIFAYIDFLGDGQQILSEPESDVISNGAVYDLEGINELEIQLSSTNALLIGFGENSGLGLNDFKTSSEVQIKEYSVEQGFFSSATEFINYSFSAIGEVFSTLKAWVDFIWIMPGLIGWFMKGYIGILLTYFLVNEIWLG